MPGAPTSAVARGRAKLAAAARHHGPDDLRVHELRRDLAAEKLAEHVRRVVDTFPPLTADQRARIAALLRPVTDAEPAA